MDPAFRGRRLGDDAARLVQRYLILELGYHRLELEIYGFNERAIAHAERVGFVREGVKRRAYRRRGEWVDGVLFALIREDLDEASAPRCSFALEHGLRVTRARIEWLEWALAQPALPNRSPAL